MTFEQILGFAAVVFFLLLQFLPRRRTAPAAEPRAESWPEPEAEARSDAFDPFVVPVPPTLPPELPRPRSAPSPTAPVVTAPRSSAPHKPVREAAWGKRAKKVSLLPGDRSGLRRAIALMEILGPPRALRPSDN